MPYIFRHLISSFCAFFRITACQFINHIIGEVEVVGIVETDGFEMVVLIQNFFHKVLIDQASFAVGFIVFDFKIVGFLAFAADDDRQKFASLRICRDHAVRMSGIQVDAVAGIEDFNFVAQLNAQLS